MILLLPGIHQSSLVTGLVVSSLQKLQDLDFEFCQQLAVLGTYGFGCAVVVAVGGKPVGQLLIVCAHFIEISVALQELWDPFGPFWKAVKHRSTQSRTLDSRYRGPTFLIVVNYS